MNLTGTAQIYCMDSAGDWPTLLTDSDNRVMALGGIAGLLLGFLALGQEPMLAQHTHGAGSSSLG